MFILLVALPLKRPTRGVSIKYCIALHCVLYGMVWYGFVLHCITALMSRRWR